MASGDGDQVGSGHGVGERFGAGERDDLVLGCSEDFHRPSVVFERGDVVPVIPEHSANREYGET